MINILYALNGPMYKGGTEAVVLGYFDNLDKDKFKIDFLIHGFLEQNLDNEIHNYLLTNGAHIYYVTPRGVNYKKNQDELRSFFDSHQYDIVHSHMDAAGYYLLKIAYRNTNSVCVSHSHNTDVKTGGNVLKKFFYTFVLKYARAKLPKVTDVRIACSNLAGKWLYGNYEYHIVNNAIDIYKFAFSEEKRSKFRSMFNCQGKTVVGHVGRFTHQKNHHFLIDIFYEYQRINPKSILVLVGKGYMEEEIKEKVINLHLTEKVKFLGIRNDVDVIMQGIDIFLLPSYHEGLPVVGIEAQTSGLPCVVSSTVSSELALSKRVKFVSLKKPPNYWAKIIDEMLKRDADRNMGKKIVKHAGYNIDDIIEQIEIIYQNALKVKKEKNVL